MSISAAVPTGKAGPGEAASGAYEKPVFQKYDDMQALLLIDPIHEVDDDGWPVANPAPTNSQE